MGKTKAKIKVVVGQVVGQVVGEKRKQRDEPSSGENTGKYADLECKAPLGLMELVSGILLDFRHDFNFGGALQIQTRAKLP